MQLRQKIQRRQFFAHICRLPIKNNRQRIGELLLLQMRPVRRNERRNKLLGLQTNRKNFVVQKKENLQTLNKNAGESNLGRDKYKEDSVSNPLND